LLIAAGDITFGFIQRDVGRRAIGSNGITVDFNSVPLRVNVENIYPLWKEISAAAFRSWLSWLIKEKH
jgi:hypothetical protein